jgi:hypothetical protein
MPGVTRSLRLYYCCLRVVSTYLSIYLRVGFNLFCAGFPRAGVSITSTYNPSFFIFPFKFASPTSLASWPRLSPHIAAADRRVGV